MALTPAQYADEIIYRKILTTRYITGQVNYVRDLVNKMTGEIARHIMARKNIETKTQFNDSRKYIRAKCLEYRDKLYKHLQKELRGYIREQAQWEYDNSPVKLKKIDTEKTVRNVFFEAYSEGDTIKSYVERIFNQIYQLWNAQLSIAYRTGQDLDEMVNFTTGRSDW